MKVRTKSIHLFCASGKWHVRIGTAVWVLNSYDDAHKMFKRAVRWLETGRLVVVPLDVETTNMAEEKLERDLINCAPRGCI